MKVNNALLVAGLMAAPLSAMASMTAMDDNELSKVSGEGYVYSIGTRPILVVRGLDELNVLGLSDAIRTFEADHPVATTAGHKFAVGVGNAALAAATVFHSGFQPAVFAQGAQHYLRSAAREG